MSPTRRPSILRADPAALLRPNAAVTDEEIRIQAYLKWEAAGRPIGHDLFFWVEAERERLHPLT